MKAEKLQAIGETLLSLVKPGMVLKDLMKAAKKAFQKRHRSRCILRDYLTR
ncbi:hypothetical protein [Mesorhizobium sp. IMUNJ 23232]|uniref:hypothetical protein n=1 Tax=Mesorhizobium sp. IMUNJ 23232 TaxID=3376064 RepID=UPI003791E6B0